MNRSNVHGLNLVVLGDSPAEIEAAQTSTYGLGIHPLLIKTVKFKEAPTCEELLEQQRIISQDLSSIVQEERDSSRNLTTRLRSSSFSYAGGGLRHDYQRPGTGSSVSYSNLSSSSNAASYNYGQSSHSPNGYLSSPMMYAA